MRQRLLTPLVLAGCAAEPSLPNGDGTGMDTSVADGSGTDAGSGTGDADTTADATAGDATMGMDATADTADTSADATDDTTGSGPECLGATECGGTTPFCDPDGTCVACDAMPDPDGACTDADAALPVCEAGECVQCTETSTAACEGQTPICATDNTCVACIEHFECPDSACHLDGPDVGACFDEADVIMAANATALESAFAGVSSGDDLVIVLTGASYSDVAVDFLANAEVAVIGDGSNDLAGNTLGGIIDTGGTSIVYLSGVTLLSNGQLGRLELGLVRPPPTAATTT